MVSFFTFFFLVAPLAGFLELSNPSAPIEPTASSGPADDLFDSITRRVEANQQDFFVYKNGDSGFNHGFASGFFGSVGKIDVDAFCLNDPEADDGCSNDPRRLDRERGNVFRLTFDPLEPGEFAGVNFEEPENHGVNRQGMGYDLRPGEQVVLEIRSPDGVQVQFGVAGSVTPFLEIPPSAKFFELVIPFASLGPPVPDPQGVHILFAVATNFDHAPDGGTVLLDNIRIEPVPTQHKGMPSLPLGTETFGVVAVEDELAGRVPIPPDQVSRNLATTFESSLALLALLERKGQRDLQLARLLAESFHHARSHDNSGLALPVAADGSRGLRNGYSSGDLHLFNDQGPGRGRKGEVRLAGFTAPELCPETGFCLVLDGATGGNVAFGILALLAAYRQFEDEAYLDDARMLSRWIEQLLRDADPDSFGGYFLGFPDEGISPKQLIMGKSTENNADIFAAFSELASIEREMGNSSQAVFWTEMANWAGDFVLRMFDEEKGRFYVGTVPSGASPAPGIQPGGPEMRMGDDVINTFDFLDANTFTTLALAAAPRYRDRLDWRRPVQYSLDNFRLSVSAGGKVFEGFNIVQEPTEGPPGIAWEFTAQMVATMRFVDQLYVESRFEDEIEFFLGQIEMAQREAPFADGRGLVAAVLEGGELLPPREHCLSTPFQCIPARVGLAATSWAAFASRGFNPLSPAFPAMPRHKLFFAQFADGAGQLSSRIMLFNLDGLNEAPAHLIFRDDAGSPLAADLNGSELEDGELRASIPPGGLRLFETDGLGRIVSGSVEVNSDRPVAGVILLEGGVGLAGVGNSATLERGFAAPVQTDLAAGLNTGLAAMNLESAENSVDLRLLDLDGNRLSSASFEAALPANGHRARFVNELEWDPPIDFSSFRGRLQANSSGRLAATIIQTQLGEFVTLPVTPTQRVGVAADTAAEQILYFAQFGEGAGLLASRIILMNLGQAMEAKSEVFLRNDLGLPLQVDLNGEAVEGLAQLALPPSGRRDLATDGLGEVQSGSVEVRADKPLSGVIIFGGSAGVAGVGSSPPLPDGFAALIETDARAGVDTGIAILNLSQSESRVHLELLGQDGNPLSSARQQLAGLGHRALFVTEAEWNPPVDFSRFLGLLRVRGEGGLAATVLQSREPGQLATMPAVPIDSGFNFLPAADAGPDQSAGEGTRVSLDGSGSSDAEGSPLTFQWTLKERPAGSAAALSDAASARPSFTADRAGRFRVALVVGDGLRESFPDTVTVTASAANRAPLANAGADQSVQQPAAAQLGKSASHDPDGTS